MILAGDIGGTKAMLLLASVRQGRMEPVFERRFAVAAYPGFSAMLAPFLDAYRQQSGRRARVTGACFGAAGPVSGARIQMTNLPWCLDGAAIAAEFGIANVRMVNDFEAAASGIEALAPDDSELLQQGAFLPDAARVVIGAGTGLGIAYALPQGKRYQVLAGEGGHAGFAPADTEQMRLWQALHAQTGRVSVEHVVSGPGLERAYAFFCAAHPELSPPKDSARAAGAAGISRLALELGDPLACRALDLFIACYGAVAGDHALIANARGGVYIAGGIAAKIFTRLAGGGFLAAFNAKGAHAQMNLRMPVRVVTTERLGLLGAALIASRL
jgi:glucokinase